MLLDRKQVLELFARGFHRPVALRDLAEELHLDRRARLRLTGIVRALVASGDLVRIKGGRFGLPRRMNLVVGELRCTPKGYGFVVPERRSLGPDVFVRLPDMGGALHGDRVVARIEHRKPDGRVSGSVIRILERASSRLLGRYELGPRLGFVVPLEDKILTQVLVAPEDALEAREGQIVEVEIVEYPGPTRDATGRIVAIVGWPDDPRIDLELVLRRARLPRTFPAEVRRAARALGAAPDPHEVARRRDFRGGVVVTIDGVHARDFDDAVAVRRLSGGGWQAEVHIADVSHYVREGSPLDEEARARGTSVYFPDHVIPMLPEELSNGLCSLNPAVDRLTLSAVIDVDPRGEVLGATFHEGVIRSRARLTYEAVHAVLAGEPAPQGVPPEVVPHLHELWRLARVLGARRRERGSLDFDLPESVILLDPAGEMTGIRRSERLTSHQLVEELMLLANEAVARHTVQQDMPSLYRVHDLPDPADVEELNRTLATFGLEVAALSPKSFREVLEKVKGRPEERLVSTLTLRTMRLAAYSPANTGHFGLAARDYTHFTSPIRRYPDLVVHRKLREWLKGETPPPDRRDEGRLDLESIAAESSRLERRAEEAEREYIERKKARFMSDKVGERFAGIVTAVESFGFFVELEEYFVEGLVHLTSLDDDYYRLDETAHALVGETGGRRFQIGQPVEVEVSHVDLLRRKVDFVTVEDAGRSRRAPRPPRPIPPRGRRAR